MPDDFVVAVQRIPIRVQGYILFYIRTVRVGRVHSISVGFEKYAEYISGILRVAVQTRWYW